MKKKIFTYISILTLSFCLLVVGVYAAKTASLTSTGTVSFTATNCKIAITAITCTGHSDKSSTLSTLSCPYSLEAKNGTTSLPPINIGSLVFDDINSAGDTVSPIAISITVKNNSDWPIKLTYGATATDTTNVETTLDKTSVASLGEGSSDTFKVTLTAKVNTTFTASNFNISINAEK